VSNKDKLFACEIMSGTKRKIKPVIINIKKKIVVAAAKELPNFNLFFKNNTKGFAIRHNISEMHKYTITVCIWYKKYKTAATINMVASALKIPFDIIFDVIMLDFE
jgi:hypothetical protein